MNLKFVFKSNLTSCFRVIIIHIITKFKIEIATTDNIV
jgi:hypothetical protein